MNNTDIDKITNCFKTICNKKHVRFTLCDNNNFSIGKNITAYFGDGFLLFTRSFDIVDCDVKEKSAKTYSVLMWLNKIIGAENAAVYLDDNTLRFRLFVLRPDIAVTLNTANSIVDYLVLKLKNYYLKFCTCILNGTGIVLSPIRKNSRRICPEFGEDVSDIYAENLFGILRSVGCYDIAISRDCYLQARYVSENTPIIVNADILRENGTVKIAFTYFFDKNTLRPANILQALNKYNTDVEYGLFTISYPQCLIYEVGFFVSDNLLPRRDIYTLSENALNRFIECISVFSRC